MKPKPVRLWMFLLLVAAFWAFIFLTLHFWLEPYSTAYAETRRGRSRSCREFLPKRHILTGSVRCGINGRNPAIKIRLALLPEMRRQNKDTDTTAHGIRGFSSVLPKVQIYLCDLLPRRENERNQNARRLDAVQTGESVCTAFICVRGTNEHFRRNR